MRPMTIALIIALLAACQSAPPPVVNDVTSFTLESPAIAEGATIPVDYTCDGKNRSPELRWHGAPTNTRSFVLIVDDPDAPGGTFTHWVRFDIPATATRLIEADQSTGVNGANGFGQIGYGGPCPPQGRGAHRYFFKLYALDVESLNLQAGTTRSDVEAALKAHVIGQAQLMGRFGR